jgi:LysR family glycine cleavage system transcriptional activator
MRMEALPPLRALQAFEAVGRRGSVTEAAAELNVSPGAVSQQIRRIEQALGVQLLERRGKGLELTHWGRLYHREIAQGFAKLRGAQDSLARARGESGLVVSCLPSVAGKWLGQRLFDWQDRHPGAPIRLIGTEVEPRLGLDRTDFRITYGDPARLFDHYAELFTDWIVPACAPALLAGREITGPAELLALPLLGIDWDLAPGTLPDWTEWARSAGLGAVEAKIALTFSLSGSAIDAAVGGRGVVLGQLAMIADEVAAGRLVIPVDHRMPLPFPYFLAWDRAALAKPFGQEFRSWIVAVARRQGALSAPPAQAGA